MYTFFFLLRFVAEDIRFPNRCLFVVLSCSERLQFSFQRIVREIFCFCLFVVLLLLPVATLTRSNIPGTVLALFLLTSPVLALFLLTSPVLALFLLTSPVLALFLLTSPVLALFLLTSPVLALFLLTSPVLALFRLQ